MAGIHKEVIPVAALAALLVPLSAQADIVPGQVVVRVGDTPTGASLPVADVRRPFVNGLSQVAFVGLLADGGNGDAFVFVGDQVVYENSDELVETLSGVEVVMGASDAGGFAYGTSVNGLDSIWTDNGLLFSEGDAPPGTPVGVSTTFHSDPHVLPGGEIYWRAGLDNGEVALFRTLSGLPGDTELVVMSGDTVDGEEIEVLRSDYANSQDDAHLAQAVFLNSLATDDFALYVDDVIVIREGDPSSLGPLWSGIGLVTINNAGDYLVYATLQSDPSNNATLTYSGNIVVREGATLDGVTIESAAIRIVGLNNTGRAAHAWGINVTDEVIFYACNAGDIAGSSVRVLRLLDELDVDGDDVGDFTITDINEGSSARGQALADDGTLYVEVDLDDGLGGGSVEAIISLSPECCGNGDTDPGEECDDGDAIDDDECTNSCTLPVCGDGIEQAGEECDDGDMIDDDECTNSCTLPVCGDGIEQAGEECDDGDMIDDDECSNSCILPNCGDGIVQTGEECDDGNVVDDDECSNSCELPVCGNGIEQADEECDDGNQIDDDRCSNACRLPVCGDGITQAGEGCDDGNTVDNDECTNMCALPSCGDGVLQDGEECDDGNMVDDDFCTNTCTVPTCGDGIVQAGEECDDGNGNDLDECTSACAYPVCGDGFLHPQQGEECDDGNTVPGDGCDENCFPEADEGTTTSGGEDTTTTTSTSGDEEGDGESSGGDGGGSAGDDGCGCDTGSRNLPSALWLALPLLALRRRRD